MRPGVYEVYENHATDPIGRPLDLVIYLDRRFEYFPHKERVKV